ncbi:ATP-binding protein [Thermodesulfobacteriota bacterium]
MIPRDAEKVLHEQLRGFPIITITGPRQSGKTTLARAVFSRKPYFSLEDPDVRQLALDDPRAFLSRMPDGAVLDEVQRAPDILSYLQTHVDTIGRMGLFLLTGSQHFGLMSGITQSLAGRTAFIELLPFSVPELDRGGVTPSNLDTMLFTGGYPPLYDRDLSPGFWIPAYVTAYVERDVRQLLNVQDLDTFQRFLRLCAGRSGQLLNFSSLATDCGITHNTAKAWISTLEASYILFLLRPHHANFRKRLVKTPKLYFYDTGLLCWLLGIQEAGQLATHPLRGSIFETFIVSELMKARFNHMKNTGFYFWRDSNGNEIDLIADSGGKLMPIEIKSGQTLNRDFFSGLERWMALAGDQAFAPTLVYGGTETMSRKETRVFSWRTAAKVLESTNISPAGR